MTSGCRRRIDAGHHRVDRPLDRRAHRLGLAPVGHDAHDRAGLEDLRGPTSRSRSPARPPAGRTSPRPPAAAGSDRRGARRGTGRRSSKSAGGSLNARWPFSPMPTSATSTGACRSSRPTSRQTAAASCSPSSRWYRRDAGRADQALEQVFPEARRDDRSGRPMYSSRWNSSTWPQSIAGLAHQAIEKHDLRRAGRGDRGARCRARRSPSGCGRPRRRGRGARAARIVEHANHGGI